MTREERDKVARSLWEIVGKPYVSLVDDVKESGGNPQEHYIRTADPRESDYNLAVFAHEAGHLAVTKMLAYKENPVREEYLATKWAADAVRACQVEPSDEMVDAWRIGISSYVTRRPQRYEPAEAFVNGGPI
jgi:hypothetical protein